MGEETISSRRRLPPVSNLQWSLSNMGEETPGWWRRTPIPWSSFNGASPTWERKRRQAPGHLARRHPPSMEPLQHGRGNNARRSRAASAPGTFNGASPTWERKLPRTLKYLIIASGLQWSLSNLGDETSLMASIDLILVALQWSLSNMGEETTTSVPPPTATSYLQWSLSNMGEETARRSRVTSARSSLQWSLSNMGEETRAPNSR